MNNMLMTDDMQVSLLKGGGAIVEVGSGAKIGKTKKGDVWIAHTVFWDKSGEPMLWMLSAEEGAAIGAWAKLKDAVLLRLP